MNTSELIDPALVEKVQAEWFARGYLTAQMDERGVTAVAKAAAEIGTPIELILSLVRNRSKYVYQTTGKNQGRAA